MYVRKSYQIAAGASQAAEDIEGLVSWMSLYAKGADIRFNVGGTATQAATSFFIGSGERLNLRIPYPGVSVSAIRAASTDGTLEIIEYS